jgi:hypothetical protein
MSDNQQLPQPDPALRRLDRLVGTWTMQANLAGSNEQNLKAHTTLRWPAGGLVLQQRPRIDLSGQQPDAPAPIGDHPPTATFPSTVCSGVAPTPLPSRWNVAGDQLPGDLHRGGLFPVRGAVPAAGAGAVTT